MDEDRPPTPAEQQALDRPWRIWASVAVAGFVAVSLLIGFILLPQGEDSGFDPLASIYRAIGIPDIEESAEPVQAGDAAVVPSQIAWTRDTRALIAGGSVERGADIAAQTCAPCHGEAGMATDPSFPNLASQSAAAIFKQLHDYASGTREGGQAALMTPIAQMLDEQQMADVAAYYASREPQDLVVAASGVPLAITRLATMGDTSRGLPSCDSCHRAGDGGPTGSPALIGQSVPYLEQQLQLFASGERRNDLFARMRNIAGQLTEDEMHRLAIYYGGKPARR